MHANVADHDRLDDVVFANVLAKATNADAVRTITIKRLHQYIGAVWLEGDAVCRKVSTEALKPHPLWCGQAKLSVAMGPPNIFMSIPASVLPRGWTHHRYC